MALSLHDISSLIRQNAIVNATTSGKAFRESTSASAGRRIMSKEGKSVSRV